MRNEVHVYKLLNESLRNDNRSLKIEMAEHLKSNDDTELMLDRTRDEVHVG